MDKFVLNLIHRPELVPEYSATVTGQGKEEDIGDKALLTESLDIFKTQQRLAHENGLKVTIQMTYASLFNDEAVEIAKHDHEVYGDEIALSLLGLPCEEFREKYKTKDFCIWMFSMEDKKAIVNDVFEKFHDRFGFYPESTGSYYMDADLTNYIKATYPTVKCAVATCWEEGPKAYHTCNNSWYTLFDGGPWAPWIPSKQNTHAPAANKEEDSGIVAIPHLSRDLIACYDGNGSNFGTHPQNVLRGMIYDTKTWDFIMWYFCAQKKCSSKDCPWIGRTDHLSSAWCDPVCSFGEDYPWCIFGCCVTAVSCKRCDFRGWCLSGCDRCA